ncbi:Z1 domain-containing protein [Sphingosinicella sp. LY1275]|uniref:Z1 domain-containing protein n=1 Tax=Sphingosinicella sp. LY1275 TaxID=3095379 RepID=UPI002ADEE54F|nr:Z1 domain-containing protein [Sphingosinicella sp. LY1275]MEA1015146.1 Z1 domain-containing protein [Sphingosinicella sp. LY1275]
MSNFYDYLKEAPPGDGLATILRRALATWDNAEGDWASDTERNTEDRRARIYELLEVSEDWIALCDENFRFRPLDPPVVISKEHTPWYTDEIKDARSYYWSKYVEQLRSQGWSDQSIHQLDESTSSVIERLANPTAEAAFQAKGLVVGYVQSGKTANFTGVISKAADAGYKLIIVMAGVLDVLRSQTQRRIDKEMIGQELLGRDYAGAPDWDEFLKHGGKPSALGSFDWYRLTGPEADYQKLGYGMDALKFEITEPSKQLWDPSNLFRASTRIAVIKKNSKIIEKLLADLRATEKAKLGAPLDQVPTLIIDDESDQASINVKRAAAPDEEQERTATNKAIVSLLKLLPRAQYVGYTATPFANVFVDPNNEEDIFPKDFLISLPRPESYMGVSDFYDLEGSPDDIESRPNERDYVRPVTGDDTKPQNLQQAIDAFVLTGALKLYRAEEDTSLRFRHHTMLAHLSHKVVDHKALADLVRGTYGSAGYDGGPGLERLEALFANDFLPVYRERGSDLPFPETFEELLSFVGDALTRIGEPEVAVKVLNNENKDDTPDFGRQSVWKILVGGTKLSRGYTVEGLTISYYRRRTGTADTLMQMGRWFGFRRGYPDLVRLYIGTDEPLDSRGNRRINLYHAFGAVCRDEEAFREELKRYAGMEDPRILPSQVPPLVPSHMLRPTAPNKMYNAKLTYRNFGGQLSESTYAPRIADTIRNNNVALAKMLDGKDARRVELQARIGGKVKNLSANVAKVSPKAMVAFLKSYQWFDPADRTARRVGNPLQLQIEFLQGKGGDPEINEWILLGPRIKDPAARLNLAGEEFDVVYRSRHAEPPFRFQTYNDPNHRAFARHISGQIELPDANQELMELRKPGRGVMIYYPVAEVDRKRKGAQTGPFTVGFTLLFPENRLKSPLAFTVHRPAEVESAVITM